MLRTRQPASYARRFEDEAGAAVSWRLKSTSSSVTRKPTVRCLHRKVWISFIAAEYSAGSSPIERKARATGVDCEEDGVVDAESDLENR